MNWCIQLIIYPPQGQVVSYFFMDVRNFQNILGFSWLLASGKCLQKWGPKEIRHNKDETCAVTCAVISSQDPCGIIC